MTPSAALLAALRQAARASMHIMMEPPAVETLRADLHGNLADVVRRMMAKKREERFQTPGGVAEVLGFFLQKQAEASGRMEATKAAPEAPAKAAMLAPNVVEPLPYPLNEVQELRPTGPVGRRNSQRRSVLPSRRTSTQSGIGAASGTIGEEDIASSHVTPRCVDARVAPRGV